MFPAGIARRIPRPYPGRFGLRHDAAVRAKGESYSAASAKG